jgi:hypothetical protein
MSGEVDHKMLFEKLVDHDGKITKMSTDIHGINEKLDPIAQGIQSMAFAFRMLLWVGAVSAPLVGVLELWEHVNHL